MKAELACLTLALCVTARAEDCETVTQRSVSTVVKPVKHVKRAQVKHVKRKKPRSPLAAIVRRLQQATPNCRIAKNVLRRRA